MEYVILAVLGVATLGTWLLLYFLIKQLGIVALQINKVAKAIENHAYTVKPSDTAYYPRKVSEDLSSMKTYMYDISRTLKTLAEKTNATTSNTRTSSKKSETNS